MGYYDDVLLACSPEEKYNVAKINEWLTKSEYKRHPLRRLGYTHNEKYQGYGLWHGLYRSFIEDEEFVAFVNTIPWAGYEPYPQLFIKKDQGCGFEEKLKLWPREVGPDARAILAENKLLTQETTLANTHAMLRHLRMYDVAMMVRDFREILELEHRAERSLLPTELIESIKRHVKIGDTPLEIE